MKPRRHLDILVHLDIDDDTYLGGEEFDPVGFLEDFQRGLRRTTEYLGDGVSVDSIESISLAVLNAITRASLESPRA